MTKVRRRIRLLIVEDDPNRIEQFRRWIPGDILYVVTSNAGSAMGILNRDRGKVYSGILLDHDLKRFNSGDLTDGKDVVSAVVKHVSPDRPVLVHSVNEQQAPIMVELLASRGFSVTRMPFPKLSKEIFLKWIDEVRETFEDDEE